MSQLVLVHEVDMQAGYSGVVCQLSTEGLNKLYIQMTSRKCLRLNQTVNFI
jgi:hypothetical protein